MRLIRRRLRLTKGKITTISQERQKLSFFFVVIFLAVFGLIVLAEVLFVDDDAAAVEGLGRAVYYEEGVEWEGPVEPVPAGDDAAGGGSGVPAGLRWMLGRSPAQQQQQQHLATSRERNGRFQKSLDLHRDEMESLIKNMSSVAAAAAAASGSSNSNRWSSAANGRKATVSTPPVPYNYSGDFLPAGSFDFSLRRHSGVDYKWQPVNGTRHKFYVYSAFYDARWSGAKRVVRVVGATKTKTPERVWCRLYFKDPAANDEEEEDEEDEEGAVYEEGASVSQRAARVLATVSVIRENWNLKYSAVFVICPLPPDTDEVPDSVSVIAAEEADRDGPSSSSSHPYRAPTNQLRVLNGDVDAAEAERRLNASSEVGVCVKPIHFDYNRTLDLLEFLELNKLLGVTHFTLYNHTMSAEVSCVLRDYVSRGEVELLPFDLNMASQREIRTEGLFAALNDCLYRNMWRFNYLLLVDLDEFVVPRHNRTLGDMIRFLDSQKGHLLSAKGRGGATALSKKLGSDRKMVSSYSFQNAFFYTQYPDDEGARGNRRLPLRTLVKTKRKTKFNPQRQRSKYICVPRRVREVGNHFIWEFSEGVTLNAPVSVGFLHHYRVCEFGGDDCKTIEYKVDRTAFRYRDDLLHNVESTLERMSPQCRLEHLLRPDVTDPPVNKVRTKRIGDGGEGEPSEERSSSLKSS